MSIKEENEKSYQINFEHRPQYLYVYVSGEHDSYEISHRYWLEVAGECNRTGYRKVLIDEDIEEDISMAEMFQLATALPQIGFQGVHVAFYDRFAEHADLNQFGELVATNRGLLARVFNNLEEAEKWLLTE